MSNSILTSTKKILGIDEAYEAFDPDVMTHINSVFSILQQLGVGPPDGFMIEDDSTVWSSYLVDDLALNSVKTYVYLRVRLLFDPPTTSYQIDATERQIKELEWRLTAHKDTQNWVSPNIPVFTIEPGEEIVFDGGSP